MTDLTPAPGGYPIKLVRDRTPEIVNPSGEPGVLFYAASRQNRLPWLQRKLAEEVGEYLVDGTFAELADVLAVVEGLAVAHGRSLDYLRAQAQADPRGGFLAGVMMYGRHPEFDGP